MSLGFICAQDISRIFYWSVGLIAPTHTQSLATKELAFKTNCHRFIMSQHFPKPSSVFHTSFCQQTFFFTADVLTCHSCNGTRLSNNISDGSALFKCLSESWLCGQTCTISVKQQKSVHTSLFFLLFTPVLCLWCVNMLFVLVWPHLVVGVVTCKTFTQLWTPPYSSMTVRLWLIHSDFS